MSFLDYSANLLDILGLDATEGFLRSHVFIDVQGIGCLPVKADGGLVVVSDVLTALGCGVIIRWVIIIGVVLRVVLGVEVVVCIRLVDVHFLEGIISIARCCECERCIPS
jgi:hypothetical protein